MKKIILISFILLIIFGCLKQNNLSDNVLNPECNSHSDCETPPEYLVQSNCAFCSACIKGKCRVICPDIFDFKTNETSKCALDTDCNCSSWRGNKTIDCICLDGSCVSVEK